MDTITGKILKMNNWPDGKIIGLAKDVGTKLMQQGLDRETVLARLDAVRQNPGHFLVDELTADLARECLRLNQKEEVSHEELRDTPLPFPIWGQEQIDQASIDQMDNAMRLPISLAGALMPDAHVGYGLPIGGVLATDNSVIPYAVGVDIACRMMMTIFDLPPHLLVDQDDRFKAILENNTRFGVGAEWKPKREH